MMNLCEPVEELKGLARDLFEVDLGLISNNFVPVSELAIEEQYLQLSFLCRDKAAVHPEWLLLAGRIKMRSISNAGPASFSEATTLLRPVLDTGYHDYVMENAFELDEMVKKERDNVFDIFAVETMLKSYLGRLKKDGSVTIVETPQYMYLRIAVFLWSPDKEAIRRMYDSLSLGKYTQASPTMFNAGMLRHQLSSCFAPDIRVFTARGSIPIRDVVVGDVVVTHLRNLKKVVQLHENELGDRRLIRLSIASEIPDIDVTHNHRIWALQKAGDDQPGWVSVESLCPGDFVAVLSRDLFKKPDNPALGQRFVRVTGKTDITPDDPHMKVYTLGVEDDHSYCIEGVVAENCFTMTIDDNMRSIAKNWHDTAIISKNSGGVGIDFSSLRHSEIGQHGESGGIVPWIKIADRILVTVDQCFHPNTTVFGIDGLKPISEVCPGDRILRGDGEMGTVKRTIPYGVNGETDFYSLSRKLGELTIDTIVSAEHPILAIKCKENLEESLKRGLVSPEYIDVRDLDTDSYVAFPVPKYEKDVGGYSLEECYAYGLILGLLPAKQEKKFQIPTTDILTTFFRSNNISFSQSNLPFTRAMFYFQEKKRIHPPFLYLPEIKAQKVLEGLEKSLSFDKGNISLNMKLGVEYLRFRLNPKPFLFDKKVWSRVQKKELVDPQTDIVFDLEMEREEGLSAETTSNYLTTLGIAHNGGKRKGSGAAYLCDWHIDIEEFLDLRKPTGPEDMRARNMFYALWISDEFMRRVEEDKQWTLFCPNKAEGLDSKYWLEFESLYRNLEEKALRGELVSFRVVRARDLWQKILLTQIETGMPYILYKDACNRKSNQKNLGTIRLSNLCSEILLFTDKDHIGSCNLGSIALPFCVHNKTFDFACLEDLTREMVRNINQTIDRNYYPSDIPEIERTNLQNRPLGIGVQGLADVFAMLDVTWLSEDAKKLNIMIFETMYFAAVDESATLAEKEGAYETFVGSPASMGYFQFDLWKMEELERNGGEVTLDSFQPHSSPSDRYDWEKLRQKMKLGMRNSLLLALMPTASSASILGNNECFEPFTQHVYSRTVLSGQYVIVNKHLVKDLQEIDLWTTETVRNIWKNGGSIAEISVEGLNKAKSERLSFLKQKYLTVFELPQKVLLDLALDRGKFVCQTQSFNCFMKSPTFRKLNAFHFHGWKGGAKTGMYYLRQNARADPINFSLDSVVIPPKKRMCNDEVCLACT